MDFGLVRDLVRSNSASAASNNGVTLASETDADANNLRLYGSGFLHKVKTSAEDDLHPAKAARISSLRECNDGGVSTQKMLSFSSPNSQLLSFSPHNASIAAFPFVSNSSGYSCGGLSGPFTPSQWMELEHQALIYKYITANVPIPSYLLIPIRKALESSGLSRFSLLKPNALRWNGFHLGFSKTDPEPGRCRRTDGKKWRCSREAVADQKYCERHMNRGRHRSRKPVEGELAVRGASLLHQHQPTNIRNHGDERKSETSMEATVGVPLEHNPISVGGPLGEALSIGTKALDLMEDRSPLGVLSKTIDGVSICNGFVVPGLVLPTLPAL